MKDDPAGETRSPFADWFAQTARALGYTSDAALAKAIGVEQSTVSRWQKRSTGKPSVAHLLKISALFGVRVEPLLVLSGHVPPDAIRQTDLPEVPAAVTAADRLISDADLPAAVKDLLRQYWDARHKEERARLTELIGILGEVQGLEKVPANVHQRAVLLARNDIAEQLAGLLKGAASVAPPRRRGRREAAKPSDVRSDSGHSDPP